ncbi:MAG: MFS transporter, partial [bacterium]
GMLIGAQIAGQVHNSFLRGAEALTLNQWNSFWWIPAGFAGAVALLFMLTFQDKTADKTAEAAAQTEA